jgi:hypothetical protein
VPYLPEHRHNPLLVTSRIARPSRRRQLNWIALVGSEAHSPQTAVLVTTRLPPHNRDMAEHIPATAPETSDAAQSPRTGCTSADSTAGNSAMGTSCARCLIAERWARRPAAAAIGSVIRGGR